MTRTMLSTSLSRLQRHVGREYPPGKLNCILQENDNVDSVQLRAGRKFLEAAAHYYEKGLEFTNHFLNPATFEHHSEWFTLEARLAVNPWLAAEQYTLADICNFAIANGMQNGFADLVNDKDTPHPVAWIRRSNERRACKLMFAKQPSEWADRRRA
jgi:hypothetical protein